MPKVNNGHLAGTNRTQVYPEQKMGPGTVWADVVKSALRRAYLNLMNECIL